MNVEINIPCGHKFECICVDRRGKSCLGLYCDVEKERESRGELSLTTENGKINEKSEWFLLIIVHP
jgi:hypothetical protein